MENLFNGVFKGKRVLLTGDTGFKGSWLSIWLKELGADVYGYALPPKSDKDNFVRTDLEKKIVHKNRRQCNKYWMTQKRYANLSLLKKIWRNC